MWQYINFYWRTDREIWQEIFTSKSQTNAPVDLWWEWVWTWLKWWIIISNKIICGRELFTPVSKVQKKFPQNHRLCNSPREFLPFVSVPAHPWGSFHKQFFSLQSLSQKFKICFNLNKNDTSKSEFCTCHDNKAVITCTEFWPYWNN